MRQEIVPPLAAGLLSLDGHSANGTLFPQPWILTPEGEVHLDTLTGTGWRLMIDGRVSDLADQGELPQPGRLRVSFVILGGMGWVERDGVVASWFDRHHCHHALVRPDHYVYGIASDLTDASTLIGAAAIELRASY